MDKLTQRKRSANMAAIKSKDMKPEMLVRQIAHGLGFRYRLHAKDLPGRPDLVVRSRKKAIFVHGCFWHQHSDSACPRTNTPKSNTAYWTKKLEGNVNRDRQVRRELQEAGWDVLIIWECQTKDRADLSKKLRNFLS